MNVSGLPDQSGETWVTRREIARIMGVSVSTIKNWDREGMPSDTWGLQLRVYQPSRCVAWARGRATRHTRSAA